MAAVHRKPRNTPRFTRQPRSAPGCASLGCAASRPFAAFRLCIAYEPTLRRTVQELAPYAGPNRQDPLADDLALVCRCRRSEDLVPRGLCQSPRDGCYGSAFGGARRGPLSLASPPMGMHLLPTCREWGRRAAGNSGPSDGFRPVARYYPDRGSTFTGTRAVRGGGHRIPARREGGFAFLVGALRPRRDRTGNANPPRPPRLSRDTGTPGILED